ncbi:2-dehydro-3-deoxygalactonokinase [Cognatishimia activa]|uniref:2-keto-3-deoxy-galactonokinase n=1 Tax=Cognatishimia activa TaxID=1715691 RepID=A0A0N7MB79_9RHOB|nr:2-dehydro-3-deoxygalactonokinase [Cognatishimia activa]CUI44459.1 2-keto-3-deoxy-galactonokinase [Cognatishimia activa]CUK24656.1 2-keto-3-deoxy-galactonokinase [Cognatishimia activa]
MSEAVRDKLVFVAVDWGTSNLRVSLLDEDGAILAKRQSDRGMAQLSREEFEPALLDLIGSDLPANKVTPVMCCGMVGSRQGWAEARYVSVPCNAPSGELATRVQSKDARIATWILPGVQQVGPDDVMRGEETQIAGFLAQNPKFDGVVCLPGTHTKWVRVSAEEIVSFQTFMTGELFALLSKESVLRHSVETEDFDQSVFLNAVSDAMSRPQSIAAKLFGIRAAHLVSDQSLTHAKSSLSGYLVGLELAGSRPYWLGMDIALIGAPALCEIYQDGLKAQGCLAKSYSAEDMTLAGLKAAFEQVKETI